MQIQCVCVCVCEIDCEIDCDARGRQLKSCRGHQIGQDAHSVIYNSMPKH